MFSTRIYYQDTDAGGVVYFANYLKFMEKSWYEYLMSIDIGLPQWEAAGFYIIVRKVDLDLLDSLRYGDTITVHTVISDVKHAYFVMYHTILKDTETTTRCETKMVCVDKEGKPRRIPETFKEILLKHKKTGSNK